MSTIKPLVYDAGNARLAEQAVVIPPGYIDGLNLVWNSGTSLSVTSGSAYIEGAASVVNVPAALTLSGLSLSASTWYHVYLYLNAGTPAIECVTTAPATAYSGTARSKTGDTSRRYLGSLLTDTSGGVCRFSHSGNSFNYVVNMAPPFRVVSGGTATSRTNVSLSSVAPVTAFEVVLNSINNSTDQQLFIDIPEIGNAGALSRYTVLANQRAPVITACPTLAIQYLYALTPSGSGAFIDLWGYNFGR